MTCFTVQVYKEKTSVCEFRSHCLPVFISPSRANYASSCSHLSTAVRKRKTIKITTATHKDIGFMKNKDFVQLVERNLSTLAICSTPILRIIVTSRVLVSGLNKIKIRQPENALTKNESLFRFFFWVLIDYIATRSSLLHEHVTVTVMQTETKCQLSVN